MVSYVIMLQSTTYLYYIFLTIADISTVTALEISYVIMLQGLHVYLFV